MQEGTCFMKEIKSTSIQPNVRERLSFVIVEIKGSVFLWHTG